MNKKPFDYILFILTIALVAFGLVMVFSASFYYTEQRWGDSHYFFRRQAFGALFGLACMICLSFIKYSYLRFIALPSLLISIGLLVVVLIIGEERNFARRWIDIFGFSMQPSEVARLSIILFLAGSISKREDRIKCFLRGILPYLILLGVFFSLILLQPNFSMAGSLVILVTIMLFAGGMRLWHLSFLGLSAAGVFWTVLKSADYRIERLTAFLDPWSDPLDTGYQLIQSLYALGAGGLDGVGFGQSIQKLLYIPHAETDFIFAIIGEEFGFIGAIILILVFLALIFRGMEIAKSAPDLFSRLLAVGITSMIAVQVMINIAVVTGSIPPTGLPLPFISFGSSSLVIFMAGVGILLNISKHLLTNHEN